MRTVRTVEQLIERAERNKDGVAIARRRIVGNVKYDTPQEVYRVEVDRAADIVRLFHFKTLTVELPRVWRGKPLFVYGESTSDADSVNTFLAYYGIDRRFTYRPVNGGFIEV